MKIRKGFVSNSSSSSFSIEKEDLTQSQIYMLLGYDGFKDNSDGWVIEEYEDLITGWTHMDNGYIHEFMEFIGITEDVNIEWKD